MAAVERLPPADRDLLVLRFLHQSSYDELAAHLGSTPTACGRCAARRSRGCDAARSGADNGDERCRMNLADAERLFERIQRFWRRRWSGPFGRSSGRAGCCCWSRWRRRRGRSDPRPKPGAAVSRVLQCGLAAARDDRRRDLVDVTWARARPITGTLTRRSRGCPGPKDQPSPRRRRRRRRRRHTPSPPALDRTDGIAREVDGHGCHGQFPTCIALVAERAPVIVANGGAEPVRLGRTNQRRGGRAARVGLVEGKYEPRAEGG